MSSNPKVSIVIPVYNGSDYLKEAIDSALSQTYNNIEVLVINDGSTDNGLTEKIALSYENRIRYYFKANGGVASALNLGIREMTGEYFSWLSHDDVYLPNKIQTQIERYRRNNNWLMLSFSNVEFIDCRSKTIRFTKHEKNHGENIKHGLYPVMYGLVNGCTLLVPKVFFTSCGFFNETLKTSNDYDMWFRLFRHYESDFIEECLIKYRLHEKQGTNTSNIYIEESNMLWSSIISEISEKEILQFESSVFIFYINMSKHLKDAGYFDAYNLVLEKAKKYYKSKSPKVSIIMPCFNSEIYLSEAVDSILNQTYADLELIIIDDFSTDCTYKIAEKYVREDYRVLLSKNIYSKGISGAMNTGLSLAKGLYVTRMDSDDISHAERIKQQVNFLDENSVYGVCSVNICFINKYGFPVSGPIYLEDNAPLEWLLFWKNPIANAPAMYRNEIITEHGIRFSDLDVAEDYDFLTQISLHCRLYQLSEVLYRYRINNNGAFRSNYASALSNSTVIAENLSASILGHNISPCHKLLTDFYINNNNKDSNSISPSEILIYAIRLLDASNTLWGWNDFEYLSAKKDLNYRMNRLLKWQYPINNHVGMGHRIARRFKSYVSYASLLVSDFLEYIKKRRRKKNQLKF